MNECPQEIAVYEAKTRLSELLNDVEQGEQFTITRRGRAVARLVGVGVGGGAGGGARRAASARRQQDDAAIAQLRELRRGVILEGDLRALIADGRD